MTLPTLIRLLLCIFLFGGSLFLYLSQGNALTELRIELPDLWEELAQLEEQNARLSYEIDQLESPARLMQLARQPEFSHLVHPLLDEVVVLPKGVCDEQ